MRLRHPDGQTVHLARLLHSQADTDVRSVMSRIDNLNPPVSDLTCVSLSLSPALASALAGSLGMRRRLQYGLRARGLEVVTLGGTFVHRSWRSWWTHVLDLARVLADLLPEDTTHGSISTTVPALGDDPWDSATRELEDLGAGLTEIAWHTGSFIRVACEMAPGTLLATVDDAVRLLSETDRTRIGVCLSPSQLASTGETPALALAKLRKAHLAVIKVRLIDIDRDDADAVGAAQATLNALLGGPHPICDHYEASSTQALDATRDEFGALGLDGIGERPMPGLGRSATA